MNTPPLTKENIIDLVTDSDLDITYSKPDASSTSQVWSDFSYIYFKGQKQKFVSCDVCKDVLVHTSSSGTSSMMKHKKSCKKIVVHKNDNTNIKDYFCRATREIQSKKAKEKIVNACTEFIALDNRPFYLISGNDFIKLAQSIFDIGKSAPKSTNLNIVDLLPHPTTISRNIDRMFDYRKSQLINICKSMKLFTVVVDFWKDTHTGIHFCGMALYHINSQIKLEHYILGCYPYDRENQSANQIRSFVENKLSEYNLKLDNQTFIVTDNENRMKSAFKNSCIRIGCSIHYLNKQLEHAFTAKEIDKVKVDCDLAQEMFTNIRKIISHVTRSHKQCQLSHKLVSYSETRFSGAFLSMDVFLQVFDEIIGVLDSNFINCYLLINKELLECICSFLKVFDKVIEELSQDTVSTIHKVLPLREYLLKHCRVNDDDHDGIKEIKLFLELRIKSIWTLHDVHYITSLLHPSFKNFDINPDLKTKAIDLLKKEISQQNPSPNVNDCSKSADSPTSTSASNVPSTHTNLLSQCFDLPRQLNNSEPTAYNELVEYMELNLQLNETDDVLLFWSNNKSKFPRLTMIVQKYFSIPASNIIVERLFSASKATINDRRTKLDSDKVNKLLFLQKNLSALKTLDNATNTESANVQLKRKTVESSSSSSTSTLIKPSQSEQETIMTVEKKLKVAEQVDVVLCDDDIPDKNNNIFDCF